MPETPIPQKLQAHAKKKGMTIAMDPKRAGVAIYQKKGRDIVFFNLADAESDLPGLLKMLDKSIHRPKAPAEKEG